MCGCWRFSVTWLAYQKRNHYKARGRTREGSFHMGAATLCPPPNSFLQHQKSTPENHKWGGGYQRGDESATTAPLLFWGWIQPFIFKKLSKWDNPISFKASGFFQQKFGQQLLWMEIYSRIAHNMLHPSVKRASRVQHTEHSDSVVQTWISLLSHEYHWETFCQSLAQILTYLTGLLRGQDKMGRDILSCLEDARRIPRTQS